MNFWRSDTEWVIKQWSGSSSSTNPVNSEISGSRSQFATEHKDNVFRQSIHSVIPHPDHTWESDRYTGNTWIKWEKEKKAYFGELAT